MTEVKKIEELIKQELEEANKKYPLFSSPHEAFAVLMEEAEELVEETDDLQETMGAMWHAVKNDYLNADIVHKVYLDAMQAIREGIQVCAMCLKTSMSEIYSDK